MEKINSDHNNHDRIIKDLTSNTNDTVPRRETLTATKNPAEDNKKSLKNNNINLHGRASNNLRNSCKDLTEDKRTLKIGSVSHNTEVNVWVNDTNIVTL